MSGEADDGRVFVRARLLAACLGPRSTAKPLPSTPTYCRMRAMRCRAVLDNAKILERAHSCGSGSRREEVVCLRGLLDLDREGAFYQEINVSRRNKTIRHFLFQSPIAEAGSRLMSVRFFSDQLLVKVPSPAPRHCGKVDDPLTARLRHPPFTFFPGSKRVYWLSSKRLTRGLI